MGIVLVIVCLGAGLNLALWAVLWRKVDGMPAAFLALARRERAQGEARALTVLQEMAAGRVGAITLSLRALEEQQIERNRDERAAAELRARVAERRAAEVVPALGAASELVRELRALLDVLFERTAVLGEPADDQDTVVFERTASGSRIAVRPPAPAMTSDAGEGGAS